MSNINGLVCPAGCPSLASGRFRLYRDNNSNSPYVEYTYTDYTSGERQSISGTSMQDAATYVAYNLPKGVVVTLMNNFVSLGSKLVGDLSGAGQCVDLIGTGQTEGVSVTEGLSLMDCNMNDTVSCFFWRNVDLDLGALVLFENINYAGNRSILFFSEWPSNQVFAIDSWYLADKVSSLDWSHVVDRQQVWLYDNIDGSGISYDNVKGWGSFTKIANLGDVGFNDHMSSFQWQGLAPMQEEIDPITLDLSFAQGETQSLSQTTTYANETSVWQNFTAYYTATESQTLTVTNSETTVVAYEFSATEEWKAKEEAGGTGAEEGGSLTLKMSQSYTNVQTTTNSSTTTVQLGFNTTVEAEPNLTTYATIVVQVGNVPATSYTTTAHRWYDQPVTGSVQDPANNNWWKRDETITIQVSGGLAGETTVQISTGPLVVAASGQ